MGRANERADTSLIRRGRTWPIALAKHAPAALILNAVGAFFFGETLDPLTPEGNVCRSRIDDPVLNRPTRSDIGHDAHVSQLIADASDDTGRGTCQAKPERRETAFLFGGNAPPLTRIARSAGAAAPHLTAPSAEPESTAVARPNRPTSAPPSVPKSPRDPHRPKSQKCP